MAGSNPAMIVRVAATIEELKRNLQEGKSQIETTTAAMSKLATSFSGDKLIQAAHNMAAAIQQVGGVSVLTTAQQARANSVFEQAAEKLRLMGQGGSYAAQQFAQLADQTKKIEPSLSLAQRATGLLTSAFGQFTAANLASTAINRLVGEVGAFVETGTKLPAVEASFNRLTAGLQQDGALMLANMTTATLGMVSNYDLMLSANKAMLLGLPVTASTMGDLAKTATILGRAMGQDATTSLNDLITALGRSSPMILDNLGLTVKVGEANDAYAAKLNKSADALTDAEKKMAFYEAAMEAARKKTTELGDQTQTLGEIATTAWTKVGNSVSAGAAMANVGIGSALSSWSGFTQFLKDSHGSFLLIPEALRLASERAKEHAAQMEFVGPINQQAAAATKDYTIELVKAMVEVNGMTKAQIASVEAAQRLGVSTADLVKQFGISEGALKVITERTKEHTDAKNQAAAASKKFGDAMEELNSAGKGWKGTLDTIDGTVVEAIKFYLQAGVSQKALAEAYGLTDAQLKSVASSMRAETEATKAATAATEALAKAHAANIDALDKEIAARKQRNEEVVKQKKIDDAAKAAELAKGNTLDVGHAARDPEIMALLKQGWSLENAQAIKLARQWGFTPQLFSPSGAPETSPDPSERVPGYQRGVENFAGGLARVHRDELLVNLPRGTDVIPANRASSAAGGGTVINVYVTQPFASPQQLYHVIDDVIMQRQRDTGMRF